jgi:hypothetical protein
MTKTDAILEAGVFSFGSFEFKNACEDLNIN